jgi:hypothetical protein
MITRTLIPDASGYGLAILVVHGLGCFSLAAHLHARWFANKAVDALTVHVWVKGGIVVWGALIVEPSYLFNSLLIDLTVGMACGVAGGWLAFTCDLAIARRLWRRARRHGGAAGHTPPDPNAHFRVKNIPTTLETRSARCRPTGLQTATTQFLAAGTRGRYRLWSTVALAVFEELIFRGFLIAVCYGLPDKTLIAGGVTGTVLVFVLSHVSFGWPQVFAKTGLAVMTVSVRLATGSVTAAVLAHVLYNVLVWRYNRGLPVLERAVPRAPFVLG